MSTLPPDYKLEAIMKAAVKAPTTTPTASKQSRTLNMAVAHTTKPKSALPKTKTGAHGEIKKSQMHRRSRTGCYTCRLRRKKCDEGTPSCTACRHLGLQCEYKRPQWWSNNETRRSQKDDIKMIIKRKKLTEKSTSTTTTTTTTATTSIHSGSGPSSSPPGLSHSLPTSATFSDPLDRTRSASIDSHYSTFNFTSPPTSAEYVVAGGVGVVPLAAGVAGSSSSAFSTPQMHPDFMFANAYAPYEVDIKTERQMYVNDVPTLRESSTSTFSTFHTPPPPGTVLPPYHPYGAGAVVMDGCGVGGMGVGGCMDMGLGHGGGMDCGVGLGMQPGAVAMPLAPLPGDGMPSSEWMEQVYSERHESTAEETLNMHFFDFSHGPATGGGSRQVAVELDEGDQRLLDHFVQFVLPTIFPILETNQHGSVGSDLILPALQNNKCYLHCCLSIAAQHIKAAVMSNGNGNGADLSAAASATTELDKDIMHHRYATISALCDALSRDENHQQVLEAALGLIFFQCSVGRFDDALPDVPWHQHFQAVASLVQKMELPRIVTETAASAAAGLPSMPVSSMSMAAGPEMEAAAAGNINAPEVQTSQTPFNMTLTAWIDILGATMQGRAPTFAHTYREKHLSPPQASSLGLRELMGCEDRVMYLISEIACLEALKATGMDDITLCQHVSVLGEQIGLTEMGEAPAKLPFNANGSLSPKQLSKNMTAAFRLAARVYLCSLVPGFSPAQASCVGLVDKLTAVLQTIPCGPAGFDRCVVWVYLMAGAASMPGSGFRDFFADRIDQAGALANVGSFGRVVSLLHEVWHQQELLMIQQQQQQQQQLPSSPPLPGSPQSVGSSLCDSSQQYIHWRDVMQMKGWDFLLI